LKRWSPTQFLFTLLLSIAAWAVLASLCLLVGSTGTGIPNAFQFGERYPRVLLASLIGAALAAAGVTYQAILRNPLADPYLLGVSSGASLAAYLWRLPIFATIGLSAVATSQQGFAFIGALLSVTAVLLLSTRRGRLEPITLLLVGVIVNVVLGAVFLLINAFIPNLTAQSGGAFAFLVGGIPTNLSADQIWISACVCAAGWIVLLAIAPHLNVATLTEAEATTLGVRINRLRWLALIVASLVTAAAVAISGPIGFVGLICPHLCRMIVGRDHRRLLPLATAAGGAMLALAEAVSRWLPLLLEKTTAETVLPVGVLTSLLGGPFFLLLLYQNRKRVGAGGMS
jgi:iron complex transport system permease protein